MPDPLDALIAQQEGRRAHPLRPVQPAPTQTTDYHTMLANLLHTSNPPVGRGVSGEPLIDQSKVGSQVGNPPILVQDPSSFSHMGDIDLPPAVKQLKALLGQ